MKPKLECRSQYFNQVELELKQEMYQYIVACLKPLYTYNNLGLRLILTVEFLLDLTVNY